METRQEFERAYCERSGITEEVYRRYRVTLPCVCETQQRPHWAAVSNDASLICDHLIFHSPSKTELMEMGSFEIRTSLSGGKRAEDIRVP